MYIYLRVLRNIIIIIGFCVKSQSVLYDAISRGPREQIGGTIICQLNQGLYAHEEDAIMQVLGRSQLNAIPAHVPRF